MFPVSLLSLQLYGCEYSQKKEESKSDHLNYEVF